MTSQIIHYVVYETPDELCFAVGTLDEKEARAWRDEIEKGDDGESFAEVRQTWVPTPLTNGCKAYVVISEEDDTLEVFETQDEVDEFLFDGPLKGAVVTEITIGRRTFLSIPL